MTALPPEKPSIEELNAYLDGELKGQRRHAVEEALTRDPDASARVAGYRRQDELLRVALSEFAVAPEHARRATFPGQSVTASGVSRRTVIFAGLALTLSATAIGGWWWTRRGVDQRRLLIELDRQAMLAHLAYAAGNTEESVPPARPVVARQLRAALGIAVAVPDLSRFGLALTAVHKPDTGPAGALLLVYTEQGGSPVSCYFTRVPGGHDTDFNHRRVGSVGAVYRIDDGIGYAVVGAWPMTRLAEIAAAGLRYDEH